MTARDQAYAMYYLPLPELRAQCERNVALAVELERIIKWKVECDSIRASQGPVAAPSDLAQRTAENKAALVRFQAVDLVAELVELRRQEAMAAVDATRQVVEAEIARTQAQ